MANNMTNSTASSTVQPPVATDAALPSLIGMSREDMATEMDAMGMPAFRAGQLWHWVYFQGAREFNHMTTLSKSFRALLAEHYSLARPEIMDYQKSSDGTHKWLLRLDDGNEVETVFIPESDRGALCLSSQVGCTLKCTFCHTGTQRLARNLTPGEMVGQVMVARDALGEWAAPSGERLLTNIVVMGMGEPFYNYDAVAAALKILMDHEGISISKRRITLSTAGVVPLMARCGADLGVNLAISLHAVRDELRDELVPLNRKYPLAQLLDAARAYPTASNVRRITFEYVMLKGVNDSPADARELARLLADIPAKVNLIPFNPWPGAPYQCSTLGAMRRFAGILNDAGLSAPLRETRGGDIMAACGQLKSESIKQQSIKTACRLRQ
jgi:23S rRNA (adenine2503-C2)-methyltransferase